MLQSTQVRVNRMIIHETGTYGQQYRRAFTTQLTGASEQLIAERIDREGTLTPAALANVANQFIIPNMTPEGTVGIEGVAWQERRMKFMMEVECSFGGLGAKSIMMVLGYTNHLGLGMNGALDPDMVFVINSIVTLRETPINTPHGVFLQRAVADNSHLLADNAFTGMRSAVPMIQRMRPEDVYVTMGRSHIADLGESTYDQRTTMTPVAVKSNRRNNIPTNYMASILDKHIGAKRMEDFGQNPMDAIEVARSQSHEQSAASDPFLTALSSARNGQIGNRFYMRDLVAVDPNVHHVMRASFMSETRRAQTHVAGQSNDWGGSDKYTYFATVLSQSVPSLMMDLNITKVKVISTNRHVDGQPKTSVLDLGTFTEMDMTLNGQMFLSRLESEIIRDLTYNNTTDYYFVMVVDLLGETKIELALDSNMNLEPYVTPSFCDALVVPCITTDTSRATTLAGDFESLATNLHGILSAGTNNGTMPAQRRSY